MTKYQCDFCPNEAVYRWLAGIWGITYGCEACNAQSQGYKVTTIKDWEASQAAMQSLTLRTMDRPD